jgi:hypothetical protein
MNKSVSKGWAQRESGFKNEFHVNERHMPAYDPLKDQYLRGYLESPLVKRQLLRNGLVRRSRRRDFLDKKLSSTARQLDELRLPSVDNIIGMSKSMQSRRGSSVLSHVLSAEELDRKDYK